VCEGWGEWSVCEGRVSGQCVKGGPGGQSLI
jgi:hypothetical protein